MKKISTFLLIATLCFTGCKEESKITYKYQQNDDLFDCDGVDMKLIKEAVYAFENYITNHYSFQGEKTVEKGYYFYWEISKGNRIPAVEFIDDHILEIRDELKKIDGLWVTIKGETTLNMNHPIAKCISDYMDNQQLKKIYDVLRETKTFKNSVFIAPLKRDVKSIMKDKGLVTYLALNTFYARILNLDFSNLEELMKLNEQKYIEEQRKFFDQNPLKPENLQKIAIDSSKIKN
jgi:hypothetical protein